MHKIVELIFTHLAIVFFKDIFVFYNSFVQILERNFSAKYPLGGDPWISPIYLLTTKCVLPTTPTFDRGWGFGKQE